jgi:energy-coupling factor transport system permease protein
MSSIGPLNISLAVLRNNLWVVSRLGLVLAAASWFTKTTDTYALTGALARIMSPLERVGVPTSGVALAVSIALRFIPEMRSEGIRVMEAQQARGLEAHPRNIRGRLASLHAIIMPLMVRAWMRSDELAMALEARGYGQGGRPTHYRQMALKRVDYAAIAVGAALLIAAKLAGG